jgi:dephospho-CoA kinase
LKPSAQLLEDCDFIKNYIIKNEKIDEKDENLKTFIAVREIPLIYNEKDSDFYVVVLIDTYNVKNQVLEHNKATTKLYRLTIKKNKVISSDNINVEDLYSNNDYSVFSKDIIEKYLQIKDSADLTKKIEKQIDGFYNETEQ